MSDLQPTIAVRDLVVEYSGFRALHGITLETTRGSIGLLGPNGAGKSTLIKTLLGFNRPKSGEVSVFGLSMPKYALDVRQRIGYMPERDVSSPRVSAVNFLTYCGRLFGMTRIDALERAHSVLNYVGLGESRYRKMETYSTGMLQRVKLAQALIHDPKLLLLDEPTNGLDPKGRVEMLELIRDITAKGEVTVLLSSHLLPDVEYVCDSVIMVNGGRVVREGRIDELRTMTADHYVVELRGEQDAFVAGIVEVGGHATPQRNGGLHVGVPAGTPPRELFRVALANQCELRRLLPLQQRLEDVFLDTVQKA